MADQYGTNGMVLDLVPAPPPLNVAEQCRMAIDAFLKSGSDYCPIIPHEGSGIEPRRLFDSLRTEVRKGKHPVRVSFRKGICGLARREQS